MCASYNFLCFRDRKIRKIKTQAINSCYIALAGFWQNGIK